MSHMHWKVRNFMNLEKGYINADIYFDFLIHLYMELIHLRMYIISSESA